LTAEAVTKSTSIHILVIWKVNYSRSSVHIVLLKNIKGFKWNEEKLKKFYNKNYDRLVRYDDSTLYKWLLDDMMILKTAFEVMYFKRNFELSISISEEKKNVYAIRPLCVDEKR
jgi:hypothetical protein